MGGFAAAAPTQNPGETFTVKAAHNPDHVPVGPLALAKAYNKYNVPMPDDLIKAVERITGEVLAGRATGEVPANPAPQGYDLEYIAEVDIGTPAQKLYFDFDTGSSDLWAFSENTPSAQVNGHPKYKPSQSSTSKKLSGYSWSISYADESSSKGDVYTDKVTIGGLTVKTQAVETATQVSSQFSKNPSSQFTGLLGLGFDKINTVQPRKQKTWFSNIKNSLDKALFTANLNHQSGKSSVATSTRTTRMANYSWQTETTTLASLTTRSTRAPSSTRQSTAPAATGASPLLAMPSATTTLSTPTLTASLTPAPV